LAVLIGRIVVYCGCYRRRHEADDVYLPSSECNSPRDNYRVASALTRVIRARTRISLRIVHAREQIS